MMTFKNNVAVLLAARSGSKRLPNKHFYKLSPNNMAIDMCINRIKKSKTVKKIFLCTTKKKEDYNFENICRKHNIQLFRGSENNVLKRFIDCGVKFSIKNIVRITADCPFVDPKIIDKCVKIHLKKNVDYTSNTLKLTYPDGLDVEVIKLESLIKSYSINKKDIYNQEHVTSFIRTSKLFKKYNVESLINYSNRRWTLDNKKDLIFLKKAANFFYPNINFSWKELILAEEKFDYLFNHKSRINLKNDFRKKIIIGSANFTQSYGLKNKKLKSNEIKKILNFAKKNKIKKIDTADAYVQNTNIFRDYANSFSLISKINPDKSWISLQHCEQELKKHIKKLKHKIDTILFHNVNILYTKEGKQIYQNLKVLKKKNYFKKVGISIYDPDCLNYLMSNYSFDIIQCPFNVFDKRMIFSGWLKKLKKKNIEVHARSIFLQGVLLNKKYSLKNYFIKWKKQFDKWFEYLKKNKISEIDFCINDIMKYNFDKIVIGVDNLKNLEEIFNFKLLSDKKKLIDFTINDLNIIDPRKWKNL